MGRWSGRPRRTRMSIVAAESSETPNRIRVRQLSDKLSQLQDELDNEKQARGEAVELKLKVLDDKMIRAQVSEEEKLKPLHDNVANLTENLYAERLAREVMDERKTKEVKTVESAISLDITAQRRARKDLEAK